MLNFDPIKYELGCLLAAAPSHLASVARTIAEDFKDHDYAAVIAAIRRHATGDTNWDHSIQELADDLEAKPSMFDLPIETARELVQQHLVKHHKVRKVRRWQDRFSQA